MSVQRTFFMRVLSSTVVIPLLALAGCSGEAQEQSHSSQVVPANIKPAQNPDPQAMEKINQLFSVTETMHKAQQKALIQCVAQHGAHIVEVPLSTYSVQKETFSPLSLEHARQYGYGNGDAVIEKSIVQQDDPQAQEFIMGNPMNGSVSVEGIGGAIAKDGCLAQSYQEVFGTPEAGVIFVGGPQAIVEPYSQAIWKDPQVKTIEQEWSQCMKEDFHQDVPNTIEARKHDSSVESAVQDAQCREKTGYDQKMATLSNAYYTTLLNDKPALIENIAQAKKTAEENAPKIIQQTP
ncbi:hypothetical protein ACN083_00685 [Rothia sp. CCM 9418]|uniref:hypothetical protein n=1 Tax=Rothia sp. CCM 9418 TaxID=3402661 RepID=UPI003AED23C0